MDQKILREEIVYTAIFGTLWGITEIFVSSLLYAARLPFRGIIMAAIATVILVVAREFVSYRSSSIVIGVIASLLKVFSMAGFAVTPVVAILLESFLAELAFLLVGYNIYSAGLSGALILVYSFSHGLIMHGVFFGISIYKTYMNIISEIASWINVTRENLYIFLIAIGLINGIIGLTVGIIGWKIAKKARSSLKETME